MSLPVAEPDVGEQLTRTRGAVRRLQSGFRHRKLDIFSRRKSGHEVEALKHESDVPQAERRGVAVPHSSDRFTADRDGTACRAVDGAEQVEQGGLSAS